MKNRKSSYHMPYSRLDHRPISRHSKLSYPSHAHKLQLRRGASENAITMFDDLTTRSFLSSPPFRVTFDTPNGDCVQRACHERLNRVRPIGVAHPVVPDPPHASSAEHLRRRYEDIPSLHHSHFGGN